jgi:3-isopropylmalate/(R)-2-methylmalate dehydratase large subunit
MTMAEKLLARASGRDHVKPGDVLFPDPELVIVHDGFIESAHRQLHGLGYRRITRPDRVVFLTDHEVIYTHPRAVERGRNNRRIAQDWQVGRFFDVGHGGHGHLFPMETGLVRPGMFMFAYDMHCTNFGAIGALCWRAGPEVVSVLATGTLWTVAPPTLRIEATGDLAPGVHPRDVGFRLCQQLTSGALGLAYEGRMVEFSGEGVERMPLPFRVALCSTLTEIGVGNIIFPALSANGDPLPDAVVQSDPDAQYEGQLTIDLGDLSPQIALPGGPERATPVGDVAGKPIDHAFIGSCGSGMFEDFEAAALAMGGRPVAPGVRFFIVPGTVEVARRLNEAGITQTFMSAGAIILPPGCGPCAGGISGPMGDGEVSISTAATNAVGRIGPPSAEAYLGSPITVAASVVSGRIVDPRAGAAVN